MKKVLSYGGGLDSFAMLVDALQRNEKPDICCFADVGDPQRLDPAEWPSTYRHLEEVVKPLCAANGIEFVWLTTDQLPIRGSRSLFGYFDAKHIIPSSASRLCTVAAKVERFAAWLDGRFPGEEVEVWVGFEKGEENRAARDPHGPKAEGAKRQRKGTSPKAIRRNRYPLIEQGLCRCRCERLVRAAGYPVPRKSACVFCPFSRKGDFKTLQRDLPETFSEVARLESSCKLTKSGLQLTIMGWDSANRHGTPLPVWAARPYRPRPMSCAVCGAEHRATKATGIDYLPEGEYVADEEESEVCCSTVDESGDEHECGALAAEVA
jgi:hypothetical protein